MAGYGYSFRGFGPRTDEWSKESYTTDHVCRPVIIDADGNKRPIECYFETVETIVEHVRSPMVIDYRHGSPPELEPVRDYGYRRVEPVKDYGYNRVEPVKDYGYNRGEPVKDYGYNKVEPVKDYGYNRGEPVKDYGYNKAEPVKDYGYKKVEPVKDYGYNKAEPVKDYGYKKVEPVKDYGYGDDRWRRPSSPVRDLPELITKVQTEASRPNRPFVQVSASYWRQAPHSNGNNGATGYGGDYSDNEWIKPSGNAIRDDNYDDYYRKNDSTMKPTMIPARPNRWAAPPPSYDGALSKPTSDIGTAIENLKEAVKPFSVTTAPPPPRFSVPVSSTVPKRDAYTESIDSREAARPNRTTWAAPPPSYDGALSKPTSNIGTDIENSKEAVKPFSFTTAPPPPRFSVPVSSTVPKRDAYTESIDSREAARRYGNNNSLSRQQTIEEPYTATITSREAAKKYGGTTV